MPFVIAGFLYGALALILLIALGIACAATKRSPGLPMLAGGLGSFVGFMIGCVAAVFIGLNGSALGARYGATAMVVPISVGLAILGLIAGAALSFPKPRTEMEME